MVVPITLPPKHPGPHVMEEDGRRRVGRGEDPADTFVEGPLVHQVPAKKRREGRDEEKVLKEHGSVQAGEDSPVEHEHVTYHGPFCLRPSLAPQLPRPTTCCEFL